LFQYLNYSRSCPEIAVDQFLNSLLSLLIHLLAGHWAASFFFGETSGVCAARRSNLFDDEMAEVSARFLLHVRQTDFHAASRLMACLPHLLLITREFRGPIERQFPALL
jgi:hypothetical protein